MRALYAGSILVVLAACAESPDADTMEKAVDRTYDVSAKQAMESAVAAIQDLDLKVQRREIDALGGSLIARRADGSEVIVAVKSLGAARSRVTIKVGDGDLGLANVVQTLVAERIKKGASRGSTFENRYAVDVNRASNAARAALKALGIGITRERQEASTGSIEAQKESVPIRIDLKLIESKSTHVIFLVGTQRSSDTDALLQQIKLEFEAALAASGDRP